MSGSSTSGDRDRKGGLSCAECRRSKLKCDRVFPCQSCIRRGCGNLCPDGTLAATKGNRVLMAQAQRLNEQVKTANGRIRDLEQALSEMQSRVGDGILHPLLKRDAGKDPAKIEFSDFETIYDDDAIHEVSDAIGSLAIGTDGKAKYHGETASSEYFQELIDRSPEEKMDFVYETKYLGLPFEVLDLVNAFPFGLKDPLCTKGQLLDFLPSRERALDLAELYYINMGWMYDPISRNDFMNNIISPIYGTTGVASLDTVHCHRLGVFFITMASGVWFDSHPSSTILAHQYHALARAAVSLEPILQEGTCATVQALFMVLRFIYTTDRSGGEERWILGGLCTRIAQIIGLQRDSAGWNLDKEEVQRRRILFWELFTHDAWTSVVNGRPPALNIQHTDCRFPDDLDALVKPSGEVEMGGHAWLYRNSASCLSISVQHVFSTRIPSYTSLLELDKKIRQFAIPSHFQTPSGSEGAWSTNEARANQQHCLVCVRESNLLYIHRSSFAQAIRAQPTNPLIHKYAPSVLAIYRSACRLISSLKGLYAVHPQLCSRQWFFWSGVFSSCIVLGALVVESPGCTLSSHALQELEEALPFYEQGSRPCRTAATLSMLLKLSKRARATFANFYSGSPQYTSSQNLQSDGPDELELLGGRKTVVNSKSSTNSPASNAASSSPHQQHISTEGQEGIPNQSEELQYGIILPSLHTYGYSRDNSATNNNQGSSDFDMTSMLGITPMAEYESQDVAPRQMPQTTQAYTPEVYNLQPPHIPVIYPPEDYRTMDIPVSNEHNQDEIWRDFIDYLGLTKPASQP